jgi:hypothetical protein
VALRSLHAIHAVQVRAAEPKWLLAVRDVQHQLLAAAQAAVQKSLLAIHVQLHPAIADVDANLESAVCSRRFSHARSVHVMLVLAMHAQ